MDGFADPFEGEPTEPWDHWDTDPAQTPEAMEAELQRETDAILGDKELRWRAEEFARAGLNPRQARALALDRSVELERVRKMMAAGCPADTAFHIVS
jgi:hypothetical protein